MRFRFLRLPSLILTALLVFSSCDGSEADTSCEALGLDATGTFTATLDGDAYRADCFQVELVDGVLSVTGFKTNLSEFVFVAVSSTEARTYSLDDVGDGPSGVDYARPSGGASYTVGTITIDSFSSDRVRGTFDVSTENGDREASGAFDVRY